MVTHIESLKVPSLCTSNALPKKDVYDGVVTKLRDNSPKIMQLTNRLNLYISEWLTNATIMSLWM